MYEPPLKHSVCNTYRNSLFSMLALHVVWQLTYLLGREGPSRLAATRCTFDVYSSQRPYFVHDFMTLFLRLIVKH